MHTKKILLYTILFICAIYFILPVYIMVVTSFKSNEEVLYSSIIALPEVWTTYGWEKGWSKNCTGTVCKGIKPYFIETFYIVIPALITTVFLGNITGYSMAMWRSRMGNILFNALVIGSFIPLQLFLIPIAITLRELGLFGNSMGLILVHTVYGLPLTTMLYRNYYVTLPSELIKAGIMDGGSFFKIFFSIVLPLSGPMTIVAVILIFSGIYNDYLFALIYGNPQTPPIMVAVLNIVNTDYGVPEYNVNMAAVMISALPTLLLYIISGKFFVRGLTRGAVKG